jgi:hypothetical protein
VDGLLGVILGEAVQSESVACPGNPLDETVVPLNLSSVSGGTLPGKVGQRTVARSLVLSVRHGVDLPGLNG